MPRLRAIERSKYRIQHDNTNLLDTLEQEIIVDKLRTQLSNAKPRSLVLKLTIYFILMLGLVFVMYPYYRSGVNSVMSTMACFTLWAPIGQLYNICHVNDQMSSSIKDMFKSISLKRLQFIIYGYLVVFIAKFFLMWGSYLDWLYIVPGLFGYLVIDQEKTQRNLLNDINKLERYKYLYKEA